MTSGRASSARAGDPVSEAFLDTSPHDPRGATSDVAFCAQAAVRVRPAGPRLHVGRSEEARALLERLLAEADGAGLCAEEVDPATHASLGNFAQGLTHFALINSAVNFGTRAEGGTDTLAGVHAGRVRRTAEVTGRPQALTPGRTASTPPASEASELPGFGDEGPQPALQEHANGRSTWPRPTT